MSSNTQWLRNLARNYADGVPGMKPEDHRAWDIADEIERLRAENLFLFDVIKDDALLVERYNAFNERRLREQQAKQKTPEATEPPTDPFQHQRS